MQQCFFFALFFFYLSDTADIRIDHHGIIGVIDHKTRFSAVYFFHLFFLDIVNLYLVCTAVAWNTRQPALRLLQRYGPAAAPDLLSQ